MDSSFGLPRQRWNMESENRKPWFMVSWSRNIHQSCQPRAYKQNWVTNSRQRPFLRRPCKEAKVCNIILLPILKQFLVFVKFWRRYSCLFQATNNFFSCFIQWKWTEVVIHFVDVCMCHKQHFSVEAHALLISWFERVWLVGEICGWILILDFLVLFIYFEVILICIHVISLMYCGSQVNCLGHL